MGGMFIHRTNKALARPGDPPNSNRALERLGCQDQPPPLPPQRLSLRWALPLIGNLCFWLAALLPIFWSVPAAASHDQPHVVILNSYHPEYFWSDSEVAGIMDQLRRVYPEIDPPIEYLDAKRYPGADQLERMKNYLAGKYRGQRVDLVIILDNPALDMMAHYRTELFPGVPLVFAGINDFTPALLQGRGKVTGVLEDEDINGTLELMLALHPHTKEVLVIHDYTTSGRLMRQEIEAMVPKFRDRVQIKFLPPATFQEVINQLRALPPSSLGLFAAFSTDRMGQSLSTATITRLFSANVNLPLYGLRDTRLGYGIVGGLLLSGRDHGMEAGKLVLRVLAGEDPDHLPIDRQRTVQPMFDYRQLTRFKIPLASLPTNSIIINRPVSFYERYKYLTLAVSWIIAFLILTVAILSIAIILQRRTQARLRESEEKYRFLVNKIPAVVFTGYGDWSVDFFDQKIEALTGYPKEEFDSRKIKWSDLILPEDLGKATQPFIEALKTTKSYVREYRIRKKDGEIGWIQALGGIFCDDAGKVDHVSGVFFDITERKEAEEKLSKNYQELQETAQQLEQSRNTLQVIIESIPVRVFWKDSDLRYLGCNTLFARDAGLSQPQQLLGKDDFTMGWREQADLYRADDRQVMESRHPKLNIVEPQTTPAGAKIWLETSKVPLQRPNGEVFGVLGVYEDITERKLMEMALRESEEKFRLVFEKAPLGIMHYDQTSTITECNEKFAEIIGAPKEEFIGFNMIRQLLDEKMREAVAASLNGELGYYEGNYHSVTAGRITPVRAIFQPIFSPDGVLSGGVTIFEDVTERKKAEEERLWFSKLESLSTLAGGIAHDFNNILTAILGNIGLAMLEGQIEPKVRERLSQAEQACLRAQTLSQQLLTFAKGGAPIKKIISIPKLLKESVGLILSGSNVLCEFSIPQDLWPMEADEGQIGQVFSNLLINADQAMPEGGIIKIRAENFSLEKESNLPLSSGKYLKLTFADQGVGISPQYLDKIFDPYFSTKQKGSGLGLATAYSILKNHSGHIKVESQIGIGTTFTVYLPAIEAGVFADEPETAKPAMGQGRVLIMDDEEMVRDVLGRILGHLGYEVDSASDGSQAIEKFVQAKAEGRPFAAVILDLTVPGGMGGQETIEKLLKIDPQVKAIVSSGYSDDPIMADFENYGFRAVIVKPYRVVPLSEILQRVITKRAN